MPKINTRANETEETKDISLRDLIFPLFRRKRLLTITFITTLVLGAIVMIVSGPSYSSHMAILVNHERMDPMVTSEATTQMITNNTVIAPEEVNSEIELMTSADVLEKVVLANGLEKPAEGFSLGDVLGKIMHPNDTHEDKVARAVKKLAKKLKPEVSTKTNVIDVSYSSPSPKRSYNVLKSLGEFYTAKHVAVYRPAGSYDFFANQTQKYQQDLATAETKLRDFAKSGVAAPDLQRTNLALTFANTVGLQHLAEQTIAADEERIRADHQQMSTTPERTTTQQASAAADKLLTELNSALIAAQTKRTQLAIKYDASYPLVKEADEEIAQDKAAIDQADKTRYVTETTDRDPTFELIREDLARTQSDLAAQKATLAATKRSVASIQTQMGDLDRKSLDQQDLMREAKADENNYLLYLAKREQERTTDALDNTRISNVAIAIPPAIPVLPVLSWPLQLLIVLGAAIFVSLAVVYAADYLDSSFHTPAEVVDILGIPVVVTVSKKTA